jgi:hypothetical protein
MGINKIEINNNLSFKSLTKKYEQKKYIEKRNIFLKITTKK